MKIKVYSYADEMITEDVVDSVFISSFNINDKEVKYVLVKNAEELSGFYIYLSVKDDLYTKQRLGLVEANLVINGLLNKIGELKEELWNSQKAEETLRELALSKNN